MPSTLLYGKPFTTVYLSLSLILQIFLTIAVVHRLLKCKAEAQSILGHTCVKHYNILSMIFAESAFMNVICSLCLLLSSVIPLPSAAPVVIQGLEQLPLSIGCFQTFLAMTPAVQVYIHGFYAKCTLVYIDILSLGLLQLPNHIPRCQRVSRELDK